MHVDAKPRPRRPEARSGDEDRDFASAPPRWSRRRVRNHWKRVRPADLLDYLGFEEISYRREILLIPRAQSGDQQAFDEVWVRNNRLVFSVVNRFAVPRCLLPDAVQAGMLGLRRAIEKFEPDRLNAFSTYAWYWIQQAVQRFHRREVTPPRVPQHLVGDLGRFRGELRACRTRGEEASLRQAWRDFKAGVYEAVDGLHRLQTARPLHRVRADRLPAITTDRDDHDRAAEDAHLIAKLLDRLLTRERFVVARRYGLEGHPPMTLEEVAKLMKVTRERVRQIQVRAENRIRAAFPSDPRLGHDEPDAVRQAHGTD